MEETNYDRKESAKTIKLLKNIIIIFICATIFYVLNPSQEDFNKYIYERESKSNNKANYEAIQLLGLNKLLNLTYERDNYYIFSTYKARNNEFSYIGVLKVFIRIQ